MFIKRIMKNSTVKKLKTKKFEEVAEGSGPKEKQKTPYRDINSPASRDAAATQKSQMKKTRCCCKG
jgi:putative cell wall-binding protein